MTQTTSPPNPGRAVVAAFEDRWAAEQAVDSLHQAGFPHDALGFALRGSDAVHGGMLSDATGAKDGKGAATGMVAGGIVGGVLAGALALIPGFGPVVLAGVLASMAGGAIAGTAVGGLLGAMTGLGVSEEEAKYYERHFNEGKAIVAVRAGDRHAEAADILVRFGGHHVHSEAVSPVKTDGVFNTP